MAQPAKAFATKPADQNSISRTHVVNQLPKFVLRPPHVYHAAFSYIHSKYISVKK